MKIFRQIEILYDFFKKIENEEKRKRKNFFSFSDFFLHFPIFQFSGKKIVSYFPILSFNNSKIDTKFQKIKIMIAKYSAKLTCFPP